MYICMCVYILCILILRKRTNALRRLYQRTRNNDELREKRKTQYFECKATYAATIRGEKIGSWKEYCDVSTASKPWGAIYKTAAVKGNTITQITSLRKPDGTLTVDTKETLSLMMETFIPRDNIGDDNEYHKKHQGPHRATSQHDGRPEIFYPRNQKHHWKHEK